MKMWTRMKCIPRQTHYHPQFLRLMCTKPLTKDLPKSENNARLLGTVSTDVYSSPVNKAKVFYLRTFNENSFYDTHKIVVPSYVVESLPGIPKTGDKLLITGKLRTSHFIQNSGKRGTYLQVMAKQIYLCDNDETEEVDKTQSSDDFQDAFKMEKISFDIKDQNQVELMAKICFEIQHENSFSTFSLALHNMWRNSDGREAEQTSFLPIFVYNETLRNIVKQLKRLDIVRVDGHLKYKPCVDDTGKKQYKGYIEANRISKLIKIQQAVNVKAQNIG